MNNGKFVVLLGNGNDSGDTEVENLFNRIGCAVETAPPRKVIDVLLDRKIDLILLDVDLVQDKAVDLVRMIRHSDRSVPIVTLAASYSSQGYDIEIDLRQAGVLACRGKPLTEEEAGWLIDSAKSYFRNRSSQALGR
jgi:two-component SAPR family response regulator